VHPFAQAGERDGIGIVCLIPEPTGDPLPTPAPEPATTDQNVNRHPKDLLFACDPNADDRTSSSRMVGLRRRVPLI
jgi:hypothetical protein